MPARPFIDRDPVPLHLRAPTPEAIGWPADVVPAAVRDGVAGLLQLAQVWSSNAPGPSDVVADPAAEVPDITNAVETAVSSGAPTIRLPAGRMRLRGPIPLLSGQRIVGMGGGLGAPATIVEYQGAAAFSLTGCTGCLIEGLLLVGSAASAGITCLDARQALIQDVAVRGAAVGIDIAGESRLIQIEQCAFATRAVGIAIDSPAKQVNVVSSRFVTGDGAGVSVGGASVTVMMCRFSRYDDRVASPHIALLSSATNASVKYNRFEGKASAAMRAVAAEENEATAHVVEHNHYSGPTQDELLVESNGPAGSARDTLGRSGESAWNLLINGSFEWPDAPAPADEPGAILLGVPARWTLRLESPDARVMVGRRIFERDADGQVLHTPDALSDPLLVDPDEAGCDAAPPGPARKRAVVLDDGQQVPATTVVGEFSATVAVPAARDGAAALVVARDETRLLRPNKVTLVGQVARGIGRPVTHDRGCTFGAYVRVVSGTASVRLHLAWSGGFVESAPLENLRLERDGPALWQRLVCRAAVDPDDPTLTPQLHIDFTGDSGDRVEVEADGGQLNAGFHLMEPGDTPVTERGGVILGPVDFDCGSAPVLTVAARLNDNDMGWGEAMWVAPGDGQLLAARTDDGREVTLTATHPNESPVPGEGVRFESGESFKRGALLRASVAPRMRSDLVVLTVAILRMGHADDVS